MSGYFQQYTDAAGTIVGTEDGGVVLLGIGIGICPRAAVPVGEEDDAFSGVGLVGAYDVACFQQGTVVGGEVYILVGDLGAEPGELVCQIVSTVDVGFRVGNARAEVHLCLHVLIGAVGIELRDVDDGFFGFCLAVACLTCRLDVVAAGYEGEQHQT